MEDVFLLPNRQDTTEKALLCCLLQDGEPAPFKKQHFIIEAKTNRAGEHDEVLVTMVITKPEHVVLHQWIVEIGHRSETYAEVTKGLQAGQNVVPHLPLPLGPAGFRLFMPELGGGRKRRGKARPSTLSWDLIL